MSLLSCHPLFRLIDFGCSILYYMFELVLRLKSDYVWYFYYALFVPFMFHLIIHSISHFIGVALCMLYIYLFYHRQIWIPKRLDPGGVRSYYTMYVYGILRSVYCHYDLHFNAFLQ